MTQRTRSSRESPLPSSSPDRVSMDLLKTIFQAEHGDVGLPSRAEAEKQTILLSDPRFQELIEIVNLAVQIHGTKAREWFSRPEPELGFVHPATLMRDPANGRKLVKQSLMNHLRGTFALGRDGRVLPKEHAAIEPAPRLIRAKRKRPAKLKIRRRN